MARKPFKTIQCTTCRGYGLVCDYGGGDFNGAVECPDCVNGSLVVYPSDRVALWAGGPLRGSWPGAYAEAGKAVPCG